LVAVPAFMRVDPVTTSGPTTGLMTTSARMRDLASGEQVMKAVASVAYGLAVGARPSLLLGAVILLVPVIQAWR
jgi:hypothetical protein